MKKIITYLYGYISVIIWCVPFSWKASRFYTVARIVGTVLLPLITLVITILGKNVIDLLAGTLEVEVPTQVLLLIFAGILSATILRKAIQGIVQYCQSMHNERMNGIISLMVMDTSLNSDLEYFDNPAFKDKLESATQDSMAISSIIWNVISAISAIVTFISVILVICQSNIWYAVAVIISSIPASLISAKFTRSLYNLSLDQINDRRQMNYAQGIAADKNYAKEIRLLNIGNWLKERYKRMWHNILNVKCKMNRKISILSGLLECLPEIVIVLISIDVGNNILNGNGTLGDYTLYTGLIGQLWIAVNTMSMTAMEIYSNRLKIDNYKSLEHFKNTITDKGDFPLIEVETISFSHVFFSYPGSQKPALINIDFEMKKEEKVALVGLNGSGKSTLIKLLLRMYEPDSGNIFINGNDIRKYKLSELRSNFSVYFQDMLNYAFSLRENFAISDLGQETTDDLIESALINASFEDILKYSPKRFNVSIMRYFDQDGIELSGGQFQKLALARTFFRRGTVLILDEPSSSLDPIAEKKYLTL